jgi:hypothetical protein
MEWEDASGENADESVRQAWLIVRPACGLSFGTFLLIRLPGRWSYFTIRVLTATQDPRQIKAHRAQAPDRKSGTVRVISPATLQRVRRLFRTW